MLFKKMVLEYNNTKKGFFTFTCKLFTFRISVYESVVPTTQDYAKYPQS